MTVRPLKALLSASQLREKAGAAVFERGQDYVTAGRILAFEGSDEAIVAMVEGSQIYEVRLWQKAGRLQYSCPCLFAMEGAFCKHCVAVGLYWQGESDSDGETNDSARGIIRIR